MSMPRRRFEMKLTDAPRDRRIAEWLDWQIAQGRDASDMVKNVLDEVITGHSALTGRPLLGAPASPVPSEAHNEIRSALESFGD